jgi:hypothetical protein
VALAAYDLADGRLAVHLVNYAAPSPAKQFQLSLGLRRKNATRVRLLSAASPQQTLAFASATGDIPAFHLYALFGDD